MRIAGKIFTVLAITTLVLSIALNVIVGFSSTYKLVFKDNLDDRTKLYYSAFYALEDVKEFTATVKNTQDNVIDNISCSYNKENTGDSAWTCTQISYKYDKNNNLMRTSYFPGNGYKYTLEGNTPSKTLYSNEDLLNYALLVPLRLQYMLAHLVIDTNSLSDGVEAEFETELDFDINTFTLTKDVELEYKTNEYEIEADYKFDNKDRVTHAYSSYYKNAVTISYEKTELHMPDLAHF